MSTAPSVMAGPVFRMVYNNEENPPRIMGDGASINWSTPGISVEMLKMVENQVGAQFQFKRLPWKRCLYTLEKAAADAIIPASYQPSRVDYGVYPTLDGKLDPSRSMHRTMNMHKAWYIISKGWPVILPPQSCRRLP